MGEQRRDFILGVVGLVVGAIGVPFFLSGRQMREAAVLQATKFAPADPALLRESQVYAGIGIACFIIGGLVLAAALLLLFLDRRSRRKAAVANADAIREQRRELAEANKAHMACFQMQNGQATEASKSLHLSELRRLRAAGMLLLAQMPDPDNLASLPDETSKMLMEECPKWHEAVVRELAPWPKERDDFARMGTEDPYMGIDAAVYTTLNIGPRVRYLRTFVELAEAQSQYTPPTDAGQLASEVYRLADKFRNEFAFMRNRQVFPSEDKQWFSARHDAARQTLRDLYSASRAARIVIPRGQEIEGHVNDLVDVFEEDGRDWAANDQTARDRVYEIGNGSRSERVVQLVDQIAQDLSRRRP